MSSPPSELSWLSSSQLNELESTVSVDTKSPAWQSNWTPINPPSKPIAATLPSPSSQSDNDDSEEPSPYASHLRKAVLSSALRIKRSLRGKKRKAPSTPPSSARKKRSATASPEGAETIVTLPDGKRKPSAEASQAAEKLDPLQLETDDSLLPIRSSKLNITASGHKRTSSEAFSIDTEDLPAKKTLVIRGVEKRSSANTVWMVEEQKAAPITLSRTDWKTFFGAVDPFNKDNQEDLFNDSNTDIEDFLETEKALTQKTTYPFPAPTLARPETCKSVEMASSPMKASTATWTPKPPMKPFIRPFHPPLPLAATSSTGPLAMFSTLHPLPICFRIAEAIRHASFAFFSSGPAAPAQTKTGNRNTDSMSLSLEIYAILHATRDNGATQTITLADLFFPDRPPYLAGTLVPRAPLGMTKSASALALLPNGHLVCAVVQLSPRTVSATSALVSSSPSPGLNNTALLAVGKYDVNVLRISQSDWNEVQHVKTILDEISPSSAPAGPSIPLKSTTEDDGQVADGARGKVL